MPSGTIGGFVARNAGAGLYSYADGAVWAQPSLVYFVRDRFGLGAYVGYDYSTRGVSYLTNRTHGVSAGVVAMAELPLGPRLGLLFAGQLGYQHRFTRREGFDSDNFEAFQQNGHLGQIVVSGSLPVLIHASSSVAFGFGPSVRWSPYVLASSDYPRATQFRPLQLGASSWIGVSF